MPASVKGRHESSSPGCAAGREATEATLAAARGKLEAVGEVATKRPEVPRNDGFVSGHVLPPAAPPASQQLQHLPQVPGPGGGGLEVTGMQAVQSGGAAGSNGAQALLAYRQPPPSQHQQQQPTVGKGEVILATQLKALPAMCVTAVGTSTTHSSLSVLHSWFPCRSIETHTTPQRARATANHDNNSVLIAPYFSLLGLFASGRARCPWRVRVGRWWGGWRVVCP